jgi:hypothetical protein|tara:strand:+ start:368 stop:619 length:252 start_codon:yes stop_codon:yes gene_type:complete
MNFTTFVVSNSMDALALAYDELNIDRDRSLAASVLVLLQELTAQYPPEMFTDDELTLIADCMTLSFCISTNIETPNEWEDNGQ